MKSGNLQSGPPPPSWGVEVDTAAVERLAEYWLDEPFPLPEWDYDGLARGLDDEQWYDYCGFAVSVLACLWPPEGEEMWRAELAGEWLEDAPGLFACFTRALRGGRLPVERFLAGPAESSRFFAGRGRLQLVEERWSRLQAIARWRQGGGSFDGLVRAADRHLPTLARLLVQHVPGYRDEVASEAGLLRFWKLANLASAIMAGRSSEAFSGIEALPVYPDYMLPRVLRHFGVLRYAEDLAEAVDRRRLIAAGSPWELAIRWATVYAGERLVEALRGRGNPVVAPALDYHLWQLGVLSEEAESFGEHHRTVTLAY